MTAASLLVKIGADISELEKGLSQVSRKVEDTGKKMTQMGKTISTRVTAPLTALAGVAVHAFGVQEKAELQLRAALQANGREVDNLFNRYNAFAKEMQRVSVVGDETTLAMLAQAESFGLTSDSAERAVKNSIAMQSAFGVNAQSALRYTAALEEGNATMLTRYIPSLRDIKDDSERAAEAQRILGNAFSSAEAEAQGSTGQLIQMKNAIGDFMEVVGEVISDAIMPFVRRVKELAEAAQSLNPEIIKMGVGIAAAAAAIGPALIIMGQLAIAISAILSPVGLVIAAVGALTAAIIYMAGNWSAIVERLSDWGWWSNMLIDMAQFFLDNFLSRIVQGVNALAELLGGAGFADPFKMLSGSLDGLRSDTKEYEHEFGSFIGAVKGGVESITGLDLSSPFKTDPVVTATSAVREFSGEIERAKVAIQQMAEVTPPEIRKVDGAVQGVTESVVESQKSFVGLEMMAGQALDRLLFGAEKLQDVLKSVVRQLASRAVMTALKMMTGTGGISGIGGFLSSVIGVNDALITSGGDVVKFHPDDNILAMKDFSNLNTGGAQTVNVRGSIDGSTIRLSNARSERFFR